MNQLDANLRTREALNEMAQRMSISPQESLVVPIYEHGVHAVADMEFNRFVCISNDPATVNKLKDAHPNFESMYHVDRLSYAKNSFKMTSENCWRWYFDLVKSKVVYGAHGPLHAEKVALYTLMQEKAAALDRVYMILRTYRLYVAKNMPVQDYIYTEKVRQATEGKGIFLETYAKVTGLTITEACDEILFRHSLDTAKLNDSERLRLVYQNLIMKEQNIGNIAKHLHAFEREARLNDNI